MVLTSYISYPSFMDKDGNVRYKRVEFINNSLLFKNNKALYMNTILKENELPGTNWVGGGGSDSSNKEVDRISGLVKERCSIA